MRACLALTLLLAAGCARSEAEWLAELSSPDPFERVLAVTALAQTGGTAMLPRVLSALDDPDAQVREAAGAALARLGPAAAPPLLEGLRPEASARDRERATSTRPLLGAAAAAPLADALLDGQHDTHAVLATLERLGPEAARPALAPLIAALAAPGDGLRRALAAQGLGSVDPTDHDALLALMLAGHDPDPQVRDAALLAAVTGLLARERLPDGVARAAAQAELDTLGKDALVPLALALREASDPATEDTPIAALAGFGTAAIGPAFDALNPRNPKHVTRAGKLVTAIGPDALPVLLAMLDAQDPPRRLLALSAIGVLGAHAASAVPRLLAVLDSPVALERWGAAYALGLIGPQDDAQLQRMLAATSGGDRILRQQLAPGLVPALLERIDAGGEHAAEWRGQLVSLMPDANAALQAAVDGGGPHAATAAAVMATPH
jgi:HEAT repeat protein